MRRILNPNTIGISIVFLVTLIIGWVVMTRPALPVFAQTASTLPSLPLKWPYQNLELGYFDGAGGAAGMKAKTAYKFRYAYLSGGATGNGWATWNPNGEFAKWWIQDSVSNGITPAFIHYTLLQSSPATGNGEDEKDFNNLNNTNTMKSWFNDFKTLMQRSAEFPNTKVLVIVEPDMWGFMQQRASNDDAKTVTAAVASTGLSELSGLPNNLSGFAQGVIKFRDLYGPNVILAFDLSVWGTKNDIIYSDPSDAEITNLANRSANFYKSLGANFDVTSTDPADRDAEFKKAHYGMNDVAWWTADDYRRHTNYVSTFVRSTGKRMVFWQIPYGNTKMKAQNNTWNHYQDNHVEYLLANRTVLQNYVNAGVIAFMFGRGSDGVTGNCDCNNDGVTNPAPVNGNNRDSINADDDGGYFTEQSKAYYSNPVALSGGTAQPEPTAAQSQPTSTPRPSSSPTTGASPTNSPIPNQPGGSAQGLKGEYFDTKDLTNLKLTRTDAQINFNWWWGSPDTLIDSNTFSVRWTGFITVPKTDLYTFHFTSDDGARLWIDSKPVFNRWFDHAPREYRGSIQLEAGKSYPIKLEYYENRGRAVAELRWSSPTLSKQVVPTTALSTQ